MIETLPFKVDIDLIKKDLQEIVKNPITLQGEEYGYSNFGGWSVLSREGTCEDGWEVGIEACDNEWYGYHLAKHLKVSHPFEHKNKTKACIGEIEKIIETLDAHGFYPRRARITMIKANTSSIVHIDDSWDDLTDNYACRVHVPILTNKKCTHWTEKGEFHMKADGSVYMLPVNIKHQIRNNSDQDRYHLIMDVFDTQGISKDLKFKDDVRIMEDSAKYFRYRVDNAKLTSIHKIIFNFMKSLYKKYK